MGKNITYKGKYDHLYTGDRHVDHGIESEREKLMKWGVNSLTDVKPIRSLNAKEQAAAKRIGSPKQQDR